ncbi:hypothetical protein [Planctomyces sp. SH-PL62]|uniref:hypothetical protein n=1 Tax=Planctomyces sp. SH-PL62 TaxID=1636152 RepID=UPI00078DF066|nr:hypothetical protein [Planctomyces sp. SH-PL62]AMV35844.1 hypothetical protein VT85_00270 [Planctomyces sp. SH-PL62]
MARLRILLMGLVLVGLGGRAGACLNDSELKTHEREFRSQYGEWVGPDEGAGEGAIRRALRHDVLLGGGAALLVGAFVVASRRDRARA